MRPEQWLTLASKPDHESRELVAQLAPLAPPLLARLETTTRAILEQAPPGSQQYHECKAILDMVDLRCRRNCLDRIPTVLVNGVHREVLGRTYGDVQDGVLEVEPYIRPGTQEDVKFRVEMRGNEDLVRAIVIDYIYDCPHVLITHFDSLARFTNLEVLVVNGCDLARLPELTGCLKLRKLDVSHNSLTSIEQLAGAPNLVEIDASRNKIRSLRGIEHLSSLKKIDLCYTELSSKQEIEKLAGAIKSFERERPGLAIARTFWFVKLGRRFDFDEDLRAFDG